MTTELWYLFLTSVLLTVLWIPFIQGSVNSAGLLTDEEYRSLRDVDKLPAWVRRANRAHLNLVEQFGAFAGLVLVAHLSGVHNAVTAWCAAIFFWLRIGHAAVYLAGTPFLRIRTVLFTLAVLTLLVFALQILLNYQPAAAA